MAKTKLPGAPREGLGRPTIMDRELAQKWGIRYVHLAVLTIDLDRIAEDSMGDLDFPFGWETVLNAKYIEKHFVEPSDRELLEDVCRSVMKTPDALGAQFPFSLRLLVEFSGWKLDGLFERWKEKPTELLSAVSEWANDDEAIRKFASRCLAVALEPPVAPPTQEALLEMSRCP